MPFPNSLKNPANVLILENAQQFREISKAIATLTENFVKACLFVRSFLGIRRSNAAKAR
jgi:hypothetical protein